MPITFEIILDAAGTPESKLYTWSFVSQLNEFGAAGTFLITGTPVITYVPADTNLTIGAPVVDTTKTLVQAVISPVAVGKGNYRLACRVMATNGTVTYGPLVVRGNLDVSQVV